jgi:hypothetical protein
MHAVADQLHDVLEDVTIERMQVVDTYIIVVPVSLIAGGEPSNRALFLDDRDANPCRSQDPGCIQTAHSGAEYHHVWRRLAGGQLNVERFWEWSLGPGGFVHVGGRHNVRRYAGEDTGFTDGPPRIGPKILRYERIFSLADIRQQCILTLICVSQIDVRKLDRVHGEGLVFRDRPNDSRSEAVFSLEEHDWHVTGCIG